MDLYDIAVARKLSSGGGGGSSDFSTAEVTVSGSGEAYEIYLPIVIEEEGMKGIITYGIREPGDYSIVLADITVGAIETEGQVTTTGNISFEGGIVHVTGNGTITIS